MLIEFVGSPNSGKTTTAAKVFESFKTTDVVAEFLPEEARRYIVSLRKARNIPYTLSPKLTDEDQLQILRNQLAIELDFVTYSNPHTVIVCDSSPLNTLLYMSDSFRQTLEVNQLISYWRALRPVVFYCKKTANTSYLTDANRVHSKSESDAIDEKIPAILAEYASNVITMVLDGNRQERYTSAFVEAISLMAKGA